MEFTTVVSRANASDSVTTMTETPQSSDHKTIVQIIPADGWVAVYEDDGTELRAPLVAWGLRSDGEVVPLDTTPEGDVSDPRATASFHRVEHATTGTD